eukprot:3926150-Pyramimonas_sp.AAC.1
MIQDEGGHHDDVVVVMMRRGRLPIVMARLMIAMVVGNRRASLGASWAFWGPSWSHLGGFSPRLGAICWVP